MSRQWMGALALALVLTTGTAYALAGSNTVFSDDIVNGQVKPQDLAPQPAWHAVQPGSTSGDACDTATMTFCSVHDFGLEQDVPWTNWGAPFAPAGYFEDSLGFVHLRGVVKNTSGTNPASPVMKVFVLPAGARPPTDVLLYSIGNGGQNAPDAAVARIDIHKNGTITLFSDCHEFELWTDCDSPGDRFLSLDGLEFRAG